MPELLVRLVELALETGTTPDQLITEVGPNNVLVDSVGFRCIERDVAARLIDQYVAQQAEASRRDAERRAQSDARAAEAGQAVLTLRQRLRARGEKQAALIAAGLDAAAVIAADDIDARVHDSSARFDEMLGQRGDSYVYHPIRKV